MQVRHSIRFTAALMTLASVSASAFADQWSDMQQRKELRCATFADVPPFVMCQGQPASARSMNFEGLRRRGFNAERISAVKSMHKSLYREDLTLSHAQSHIAGLVETHPDAKADVSLMVDFLASVSPQRGIVR